MRIQMRSLMYLAMLTLLSAVLMCTGCSSNMASPSQPQDQADQSGASSAILPTVTPSPPQDTEKVADTLTSSSIALDELGIELIPIADFLSQPVFATHAGDGSGRLFIVEKAGTIHIVSSGEVVSEPFLDIQDRVGGSHSEQGLLGLAFAPDYAETGYFFVNYTDGDGNTLIARYGVDRDDVNTADKASEFQVLSIAQPAANHNGGMLAFGPDGYLYIGTGDGGASFDRYGNGQNPDALLGKMLRIDVTSDPSKPYLIPQDNPWIEVDIDGVDVLDEIWALGLRNPWRFSFDRLTGDLYIADVGQNQYEEINIAPVGSGGGLNYGWPIQEASHCLEAGCGATGLVQPILEYNHRGHCSVTGGYVYRGEQFPDMHGVYFFGDYCSGTIWATRRDGDGEWQSAAVLDTNSQISSFGEDEAGELYLVDLNGTLYQVEQSAD